MYVAWRRYRCWSGLAIDRSRVQFPAGTTFTWHRSTQPGIHPGSLNRVHASAGGKGGIFTFVGWQVILCDPMACVYSCSGEDELLLTALGYTVYFTFLYFTCMC